MTICTICDGGFDIDAEGGIRGAIGMLPVAFCPACKAGIFDFAEQHTFPEEGAVMSDCLCSCGGLDWSDHSEYCPTNMRGRIKELEARVKEATHNAAVAIGKDEQQQKEIERLRGEIVKLLSEINGLNIKLCPRYPHTNGGDYCYCGWGKKTDTSNRAALGGEKDGM